MKKNLLLGLLAVSFSASAVAAQDDSVMRSLEAQIRDTKTNNVDMSGGSGFRSQGANDTAVYFTGNVKPEYVHQWRTETLNKANPDQFSSFSNRVELGMRATYGEERYGVPGVEAGVTLRHKHKAGKFDVLSTEKSSFKVGEALQEIDGAALNHPLAWVKHLWLKASLNALTGRNAATDHSLQIGLFDFTVGRGIALGAFHGSQKKHLGVFTARNDFAPYGALLSGELLKNRLAYDVYFARFEEKSAGWSQTFNRDMSHVIGRRANPASGTNKSNDVVAARMKFTYDTLSLGDITSESYLVHNSADNQHVEVANDSSSNLGILGWNFEYKNNDLEFGFEFAKNFGHQEVFAIDRNKIALSSIQGVMIGKDAGDTSVTTEVQAVVPTMSHITMNNGAADLTAVLNTDIQAANNNYDGTVNSTTIGTANIGDADRDIKNAPNRYRTAYKNNYRGWMVVADATYHWRKHNVKLHAGAGHASGDANPHNTMKNDTTNRNEISYHGFVGLNENYAGKRVKSIFVLNSRLGQRPHVTEDGNVLFDKSFTDMTFVGLGAEWNLPKRNIDVNANLITFFKDKSGFKTKGSGDSASVSEEKSDKHLGTEANVSMTWKLLPGLKLGADVAVFLPGKYYNQVKGIGISDKAIAVIEKSDTSGYTQSKPTLGNDPALHFNVGMQYSF